MVYGNPSISVVVLRTMLISHTLPFWNPSAYVKLLKERERDKIREYPSGYIIK